jgi:hypothetical protein
MRLNREQFDALIVLGACNPEHSDLSKNIVVDLRTARLFPRVDENSLMDFYNEKLAQLKAEARFDKLETIRKGARDFLKTNNLVPFDGWDESGREYHAPDPDKVSVYCKYTSVVCILPNEEIIAVVDDTSYRKNIGTATKPKYTYTPSQYRILMADFMAAKAAIKVNAERLRLIELGLLESYSGIQIGIDNEHTIAFDIVEKTESFRCHKDKVEAFKRDHADLIAPTPERVKANGGKLVTQVADNRI